MSGEIIYGLPREEYDAIQRPSFSRLKHFARSPAHYKAALTATRDTDALRLGRVIHLALLEPDVLPKYVVVWEGGRRAGKEWDAFAKANATREIVKPDEMGMVQDMVLGILGRREIATFLTGPSEVTVLAELDGVQVKARLDKVSSLGAIIDPKSARDASPEAFGRAALNLYYHAQAAFYSDAYRAASGEDKCRPFGLLAMEKEAPYASALYFVGDEAMELGRSAYLGWLAQYKLCAELGDFPQYEAVQFLQLPRWSGVSGEGFSEGDE